jgi:hypothetical protein
MDIEDVEVTPLHMILDLNGVLVGKEYFRINHLMSSPFNLVWGPILLQDKNVIPRPIIKELFLRCLQQFIIYIWTFTLFAKMNVYLKKITKETGIEINLQRTMGQDLCKINKHFL